MSNQSSSKIICEILNLINVNNDEVDTATLEEYVGRKNKKYKRIKINNIYIVKKLDVVKFKCVECEQIKSQLFKNRKHFFQKNLMCGSCVYKQNILKKYGVDNPWKSKEIQKKIKQTNLEKFGATNVLCKESSIKEKIRNSMLERHGVYHSFENGILREKIKQTNLERYGTPSYVESERFRQQISEIEKATYSKKEKEVADWVKSLGIEIIENSYNIILPQELDIYIPSHNLAIEFNGLYWHCDLFKDSNYHIQKTELCESKNIRLIHIFEDEWIYKKDIVKSRY